MNKTEAHNNLLGVIKLLPSTVIDNDYLIELKTRGGEKLFKHIQLLTGKKTIPAILRQWNGKTLEELRDYHELSETGDEANLRARINIPVSTRPVNKKTSGKDIRIEFMAGGQLSKVVEQLRKVADNIERLETREINRGTIIQWPNLRGYINQAPKK